MNSPPDFAAHATVPVARYRFTAIVREHLQLPQYAGSLLRGQFGAALRQLACMTRQPACGGCPLLQTCPYSRIFEAPAPPKGAHALQDFSQIPNPFVMEAPPPGARMLAPGEHLVFHLVLVGHAVEQLALILFALQRALAHGLTRERAVAELVQVEFLRPHQAPHTVWMQDDSLLVAHAPTLTLPAPPTGLSELSLQILTPLRLQHQGRPLGVGEVTPRALVAALVRRVALLMEFHAGRVDWGSAAKATVGMALALRDARELRWIDWTRYSSRQRQEMTLGGLLGRWTLTGDASQLAALWPWFWLGQWLHVGKNATMGMGQYTLRADPA